MQCGQQDNFLADACSRLPSLPSADNRLLADRQVIDAIGLPTFQLMDELARVAGALQYFACCAAAKCTLLGGADSHEYYLGKHYKVWEMGQPEEAQARFQPTLGTVVVPSIYIGFPLQDRFGNVRPSCCYLLRWALFSHTRAQSGSNTEQLCSCL